MQIFMLRDLAASVDLQPARKRILQLDHADDDMQLDRDSFLTCVIGLRMDLAPGNS